MTTPPRVCITGAASGIGLATAARFAAACDDVIMVDQRADQLETAAGSFDALNCKVATRVCDLTDEDQVAELFAGLPPLDHLILSSGVSSNSFIESTTLHDWNYLLSTNLTGAFLCLKYAAPKLRQTKSASVVAVSSISNQVIGASGSCAAYEASQAGLKQLIRAFAVEYAPEGIRANLVSPGQLHSSESAMAQAVPRRVFTSPAGQKRPRLPVSAPLQTEADPSDIAETIHFLTSNGASFLTGAELVADGGYTRI